ncbi:U32 family peptidase [Desulforhopalus singaporensis]|uniref:Collagenase-like protease, PrtC family n=1 Tax=Desulforhopalus singaporensis TaxID=91360 RepID=A0A1H0PVU6_9BACT|nr:U32 family peptidase [Desulforhopalus singaporensis]SDP08666.1 Collagenase-like protease, PrtC family [Desulforhopalus singaporensis]
MRKFSVPTPFTSGFIEQLAELNEEFDGSGGRIFEIYGSFQSGAFHSARPAKYLPAIDKNQFRSHVGRGREKGIRFNYLLNAPAYANLEYTSEGRKKLEELLSFLVDSGVASITVAVPYLAEIISRCFPQLEVVVSTIGYVNSLAGIGQYRDIGVGRIVVDVEVNRDFRFLEKGVAEGRTDLEVIVNPVCISQCHFKYNHYCVASTGAQSFLHGGAGAPYNQYYLNWCFLKKLQNGVEILKSPWIRPEDIGVWQETGISFFKIAGRGLDDTRIVQLCRGYLERRFSGNLLDLLGWPHWLTFRENPDGTCLEPLEIMLDNSMLEGFLKFFAEHKPQCRYGCSGCGHCERWARRALRYNDRKLLDLYSKNMEENLSSLVAQIPSGMQTVEAAEKWRRQAGEQRVDG